MQEPAAAAAVDGLQLALRFGAALGLGVLLGLERERTKTQRLLPPLAAAPPGGASHGERG